MFGFHDVTILIWMSIAKQNIVALYIEMSILCDIFYLLWCSIVAYSHSQLKTFDECQLRFRYKYIDKIPEPATTPSPALKF